MFVHHVLCLQDRTSSWSRFVHYILSLELLGLVTRGDSEIHPPSCLLPAHPRPQSINRTRSSASRSFLLSQIERVMGSGTH